jgi:hypothetical protein
MSDEESWSIWDHITGECFQGQHKGKQLDFWPIALTTAAAALIDYPDLTVSFSSFKSFKARLLQLVHRRKLDSKGYLPPPFHRTMAGAIDDRLDKLTQGLGVIVDSMGKYYPMRAVPKGGSIEDVWLERPLKIERGAIDGIPKATWLDNGDVPMQLLSRWYGFSFTFPGCEIYDPA